VALNANQVVTEDKSFVYPYMNWSTLHHFFPLFSVYGVLWSTSRQKTKKKWVYESDVISIKIMNVLGLSTSKKKPLHYFM